MLRRSLPERELECCLEHNPSKAYRRGLRCRLERPFDADKSGGSPRGDNDCQTRKLRQALNSPDSHPPVSHECGP
jgi:hypothetical protein